MTVADDVLIATADTEPGTAVFDSAESALRFLFRQPLSSKQRDSLANLQQRGESLGSRNWRDAALRPPGTAGQLWDRLRPMSDAHMAVLILQYAPHSYPCDCARLCCARWAHNPERIAAVRYMNDRSAQALAGSMSSYQLRDGYVRRWGRDKNVKLNRLAEKCGVHEDTASQQNRKVAAYLSDVYKHALAQAETLLSDRIA